MATLNVRTLGDYIRDQREHSQVSLRQLARQAGVSNPYLSQIERGLRKPSAEILQQIAKALRISAEALYVQAGILDARDAEGTVPSAVLADATINERQKQVLLEIYDSFRKENEAKALTAEALAVVHDAGDAAAETLIVPARAVKEAVSKAATKSTSATKSGVAKATKSVASAPKKAAAKAAKPAKAAPRKAAKPRAGAADAANAAGVNGAASAAGTSDTPAPASPVNPS